VIASVTGRVVAVQEESAVIEVGGVGLQISCPPVTIRSLAVGETATLMTSLVVREDSLTLFGFGDADQRLVFGLLQSVSGVGPRLALTILGALTTDQLRSAIAAEDEKSLMMVPGIGRKSAGRLILELADRIGPPVQAAVDVRETGARTGERAGERTTDGWRGPVTDALVGLGWSAAEAQVAVSEVARMEKAGSEATNGDGARGDRVSEMLRLALRSMGGPSNRKDGGS